MSHCIHIKLLAAPIQPRRPRIKIMQASGKFALVTGAARGIGRAIATKLLENGAAGVCLVDINQEQLEVTAHELSQNYPAAIVCHFVADLRKNEQHERAFAYAREQFGKLHIVANNAGVYDEGNPELVASVNFVAPYRGTMLALKLMRQDTSEGGKGGVIINMASIAGIIIVPWAPVYCASKQAVVAFTRSIAADHHYCKTGVRLCCLCPGLTDTDMARTIDLELKDKEQFKYMKLAIMKPETVAEAFMELVRDDSAHGKALKVLAADKISFHEFKDEETAGLQIDEKKC